MKNKMIGIYKITNIVDNKCYIGQSIDIKARWHRHESDLRRNIHHNHHLQSAWNRYGEDNFKFEIIEICAKENINDLELFYIKKYKSFSREYGYNLDLGGNSGYPSDESKEKMRKSQKSKPIYQYNLFGNMVKYWEHGARHASKETGIPQSNIWNCLNNKTKTAGKFIWVYPEDCDNINFYERSHDKEQGTPVVRLDLNNEFICKYNSISKTRKDGFDIRAVTRCCKKKAIQHKGFKFVYYEDYLNQAESQ